MDYAAAWSAATELLTDEVVPQPKPAYLQLTQLRSVIDDTVLLVVPDAFTRDVVDSQLRPAIVEALRRILARAVQVVVTVGSAGDASGSVLNGPVAAAAM